MSLRTNVYFYDFHVRVREADSRFRLSRSNVISCDFISLACTQGTRVSSTRTLAVFSLSLSLSLSLSYIFLFR